MPQLGTKDGSISYQMSQKSAQIDWLINTYGDHLELLDAHNKTAVWSVLVFWQAQDTEFQFIYDPDCYESFTLDDGIRDYPSDLPNEAEEILNRLCGVSDEACFDLIVAISHQIRAGIFAEPEEND